MSYTVKIEAFFVRFLRHLTQHGRWSVELGIWDASAGRNYGVVVGNGSSVYEAWINALDQIESVISGAEKESERE